MSQISKRKSVLTASLNWCRMLSNVIYTGEKEEFNPLQIATDLGCVLNRNTKDQLKYCRALYYIFHFLYSNSLENKDLKVRLNTQFEVGETDCYFYLLVVEVFILQEQLLREFYKECGVTAITDEYVEKSTEDKEEKKKPLSTYIPFMELYSKKPNDGLKLLTDRVSPMLMDKYYFRFASLLPLLNYCLEIPLVECKEIEQHLHDYINKNSKKSLKQLFEKARQKVRCAGIWLKAKQAWLTAETAEQRGKADLDALEKAKDFFATCQYHLKAAKSFSIPITEMWIQGCEFEKRLSIAHLYEAKGDSGWALHEFEQLENLGWKDEENMITKVKEQMKILNIYKPSKKDLENPRCVAVEQLDVFLKGDPAVRVVPPFKFVG